MKAVVVAGGDAHARDASALDSADLVIAADSGATWLDGLGRRPDVLVGDLDSVEPQLVARLAEAGVTVERHPRTKDEADAELAVDHAVRAGATRVTILGALAGQRLDHELANLLLLADPRWLAAGVDLRIARDGTLVRPLHGGGSLDLEAAPGDWVTLLPVGGDAEAVQTHGLRFPLNRERLPFGRSRGLSNEVVERPASVSLESGVLLVIETAKGVDQ